jgi:peptidoglycan-N-acetylglucosamine deacetylase
MSGPHAVWAIRCQADKRRQSPAPDPVLLKATRFTADTAPEAAVIQLHAPRCQGVSAVMPPSWFSGTVPAMRDELAVWVPRWVAPLFDSAVWQLPITAPPCTVCLTFDDGPCPGSTERLLESLSRHAVTAVFFLRGDQAAKHPWLVRAIQHAGHDIGSHSYAHLDAWRSPVREVLFDWNRATGVLEQLMGERVQWMRPPFGHFTLPLIRWSRRTGQRIVMWDCSVPDYRDGQDSARLLARLERQRRPRSIVLLHDNPTAKQVTPDLLAELLPRWRDAGWRFASLPSELAFVPPVASSGRAA